MIIKLSGGSKLELDLLKKIAKLCYSLFVEKKVKKIAHYPHGMDPPLPPPKRKPRPKKPRDEQDSNSSND